VASRDFASRLTRRARRAGVEPPPGCLARLDAYFELLRKWNRRINLTALPLEPPSDEALDRLVIEPLVAAKQARDSDRLCIDVGSGGGSPGIPFHLAAPWVRLVLVEVKVRKSAFLREVVRQLDLSGVTVENRRFEELLARADLLESADLVTMRAVRPDARLWNTVQAFLKPRGRVLWFGASDSERVAKSPMLSETARIPLVASLGSQLVVMEKGNMAFAQN
jgi:16S rRNA (guanine527-N7)-methyltransferase